MLRGPDLPFVLTLPLISRLSLPLTSYPISDASTLIRNMKLSLAAVLLHLLVKLKGVQCSSARVQVNSEQDAVVEGKKVTDSQERRVLAGEMLAYTTSSVTSITLMVGGVVL